MRGVGTYQWTVTQLSIALNPLSLESLERTSQTILAELNTARHDFIADLPWYPINHYRMCDWWETLGKVYEMRKRAEQKRALGDAA